MQLISKETTQHHAGGKSTFPMLPGVIGDALFTGDRKEHRLWLSRDGLLNDHKITMTGNYALWLGMNPSTANHLQDDLTVRKDQVFTQRLGLSKMYKVNAGSYCCTDPRKLLLAGININHPQNHDTIRDLAGEASLIVISTGEPPEVLKPWATAIIRLLRLDGRKMMCLGKTKSGWPKHSSRLAYATTLESL